MLRRTASRRRRQPLATHSMTAKRRLFSTDAISRLTAAALRGMLHLLYVGERDRTPPAYGPPVRAVRLIIFLVAAWRAASSTGRSSPIFVFLHSKVPSIKVPNFVLFRQSFYELSAAKVRRFRRRPTDR